MKLYTGIELGTNSIKVVILNKVKEKFHLIDKAEVKTIGIKRGKITNSKIVAKDLNDAIKELEDKLRVNINKCIICIPAHDIEFGIESSKIEITDGVVTGDDITDSIKAAASGKINKDYELISSLPIGFKLDDGKLYKNPIGKNSSTLSLKMVLTSIPRKNLYPLLDVINLCGLELIDLTFKNIADYYEIRNNNTDRTVGAIINIGEDTTNISIYNKGIIIKSSIINVGSASLDHDISYIYKLRLKDSRKIKEIFATGSIKTADKYEEMTIKNEAGEDIKINQYEITEIAESRIEEILKLAKKEINCLTNRKISYIIILGGITEMTGFSQTAIKIYGNTVDIGESEILGLRHNKFRTVSGLIKYFDDKLNLRNKEVEMFSKDAEEIIATIEKDDYKKIFQEFTN